MRVRLSHHDSGPIAGCVNRCLGAISSITCITPLAQCVNYGWRYRRGLPISSSIAESAVNEVVSARCAKKRRMRWNDEGAHLLVQIRVAALNGELKVREQPIPRRFASKGKCDDQWERAA